MPEVSVIVPIYNSESYLRVCLDSLTSQDFPDLEVVLVDDGSRDSSPAICMEYCAGFPFFHYYRKENGGLADALNYGIAKAKGRWLAFVDSDDYVERNFIRRLHAAAAAGGAKMACCGYYEERGRNRQRVAYSSSGQIEGRKLFESILSGEEIGNFVCNKIFDAGLFNGIEFPRGRRYEDIRTFYKLADRCENVAVLDEPLYHYVYRKSSLAHGYGTGNAKELMDACGELCRYIREKYPSLSKECDRYLFLEHIYNLNTLSKAGVFPGEDVWNVSLKYLEENRAQVKNLSSKYKLSACLLMGIPKIYSRILYQKERFGEWKAEGIRVIRSDQSGETGRNSEVCSREKSEIFHTDSSLSDIGCAPMISVIIPVYRVERWLDRCLLSVVRQSYQDLEILLIDDGSPDRCGEICEEWAKKDARIRVIHKQNAGLGMARNTGVEAARGEYIAFVDSDDYISRDMILTLYRRIKETGAQACYGGCIDVDEAGRKHCGIPPKRLSYTGKRELLAFVKEVIGKRPQESGNCFTGMSAWGNLYDVSLFREDGIRFRKEQKVLCEDLFFNIAVCRKVCRVVIAPHCLYYYCANEGTLTKAYRAGRFEAAKKMRKLLVKEFGQEIRHDEDLVRRIDRNYLDNLILCLKLEILYRRENGRSHCKRQIRRMLNDQTTRRILSCYPVHRMETKQRLLFTMMKLRMVLPVFWMFRLRYHM